jgi:heme-binding protein
MAYTILRRRLHWPVAVAGGCAIVTLILIAACSSRSTHYTAPDVLAPSGLTADAQVRELLVNSCFDCHSSQKPAAWKARLAPSYLFGLDKARHVLNFSEWPTYAAQRKRTALDAIAEVVVNGSMPPGDYDFVRPGARLSAEQKQLLLGWASSQTVPAH